MKYPDFSESKILQDLPTLAAQAGKRANAHALSTLGKVVMVKGGHVVEASLDGSVRALFAVSPATVVKKGLVLKRRTKK
ncbi:hypothetical protein [Rubrivivax gelatinosus]|uniref:hypothetical protein n=1 Tax=Rubrivivax gelatinosus TaxID=28068 RepID=UPI00190375FF|nr:hypothetical protein [Rubrivivax gelatinosus]